ncbi:MAG: DUF2953 domain-containing protein [Bilifractor sp.]|jgi:hypothetical protein
MLAVFLHILSTIGIVLLWIVGIILILILLLLFTPFFYRVNLKKHGEEIRADARIWWLFHFFHADFHFSRSGGKNTTDGEARILGIPLRKLIGRIKEKRKQHKDKAAAPGTGAKTFHSASEARGETWSAAKKRPTVTPGQWKYTPDRETEENAQTLDVEVTEGERPGLFARFGARISSLFRRIRKALHRFFTSAGEALQKVRRILASIAGWIDYLESESFYCFKEMALKQIGALIHHILPRRIDGYVEFGTDDPALTGQILGIFAIFYPKIPGSLQIRTDFQQKVLEGDADLRGHIILIVPLVRILRIVTNKEFRVLMRRIRGREPSQTENGGEGGSTGHKKKKDGRSRRTKAA